MFDVSKIAITLEILKLIAQIDEFKGAWQLFSRLDPKRLSRLQEIVIIQIIGSSTRIEGVQLSDKEIAQLLSSLKTYQPISQDEQEVAGYAFVCDQIFDNFAAMEFSENLIFQLHKWLLQYSSKDERHRGYYKKLTNDVHAFNEKGESLGVVFATATPFETPFKMQELVFWTKQELEQKTMHPLIIIAVFIVTFLAIHPFQDGNGRLSRVLTTLLLLQAGYSYIPYSSLESIIEKSKDMYYLALRQTQITLSLEVPNFTPWLLFFLRALSKQKIHLEEKIRREQVLMYHVSPLGSQILTLLADHGKLHAADLVRLTSANRNTLKKQLADLVATGHLMRLGKGKATMYALRA